MAQEQSTEQLLEGLSFTGIQEGESFEGLDSIQPISNGVDLEQEEALEEAVPKKTPNDPPTPTSQEQEEEEQEEPEKKEEQEEEEESVFEVFKKSLGYEIEGEFDDSLEGLIEYTKNAIPKAAEDKVAEIFESFPEVGALYQHLAQGHSIDSFIEAMQQPEFANVELSEDNVRSQKEIIRTYGRMRGLSDDDIEDLIDVAESKDQLFDKAKAYQTKIKEHHQQSIEERKQKEREEYEANQRAYQEAVKQANDLIKGGKILNAQIPVVEQKRFFDYIFKPVTKEGYTQADIDAQSLDMQQRLYLNYLTFKGLKQVEQPKRSLNETFRRKSPSGSRKTGGGDLNSLRPINELI